MAHMYLIFSPVFPHCTYLSTTVSSYHLRCTHFSMVSCSLYIYSWYRQSSCQYVVLQLFFWTYLLSLSYHISVSNCAHIHAHHQHAIHYHGCHAGYTHIGSDSSPMYVTLVAGIPWYIMPTVISGTMVTLFIRCSVVCISPSTLLVISMSPNRCHYIHNVTCTYMIVVTEITTPHHNLHTQNEDCKWSHYCHHHDYHLSQYQWKDVGLSDPVGVTGMTLPMVNVDPVVEQGTIMIHSGIHVVHSG